MPRSDARAREDTPASEGRAASEDVAAGEATPKCEDAALRVEAIARESAAERGAAARLESPLTTLTRDDALAQAPAAMRETLELFLLKTQRENLTPGELDALRTLDASHTPAVIQKAISRAVERLARRGEPPSALTLDYIQQSLRHFTTRSRLGAQRGAGARRETDPQPSYPAGVTRLW